MIKRRQTSFQLITLLGVFIFSLFATSVSRGDALAFAGRVTDRFLTATNETTNRLINGRNCPPVSAAEAAMLNCPRGSLAQLDDAVMGRIFSIGAERHRQQMVCAASMVTGYLRPGSTIPRQLAADAASKVATLRVLRNRISQLHGQMAVGQYAGTDSSQLTSPTAFRAHRQATGPMQREMETAARQYAAILSSIPLKNFVNGERLIQNALGGREAITEASVRAALRSELGAYQHNTRSFDMRRRGPQNYEMGRDDREWLFANGQPEEWLSANVRRTPAGQALMCRMDARYGRGIAATHATVFLGTFALEGVGLALKITSDGARAIQAVRAGRGMPMFESTAQVITVAGRSLATPAVIDDVRRQCFSANTPQMAVQARCTPHSDQQIQARITQGNCALSIVLAGLVAHGVASEVPAVRNGVNALATRLTAQTRARAPALRPLESAPARATSAAGTRSPAPSAAQAPQTAPVGALARERRGASSLLRTPAQGREALKRSHGSMTFTSRVQNENYLELAREAFPDGNTVFFISENGMMGPLNSALRDRSLVTALTNRHIELTNEQIRRLIASNPGLRYRVMADPKGIRYAFQGRLPRDLEAQLNRAFQNANRQFAEEMRASRVLRDSDDPARIFTAGHGESEAGAEAMAQEARDVAAQLSSGTADRRILAREGSSGGTRVLSSMNPEDRRFSEQRFAAFRVEQARLESRPRLQTLLEGGSGQRIPRGDVLDVVRRGSAESALNILRNRYPMAELTIDDVEQLMNYARAPGRLAPALRNSSREIPDLAPADLGGASLDFRGMGVENIRATALGLAQSTNLDDAFTAVRAGEVRVTAEFAARSQATREIFGDLVRMNCSGDDCVAAFVRELTVPERQGLLNRLAQNPQTREIRMAYIRPGIRNVSDRTLLANHGEEIEKLMRKELENPTTGATRVPFERLRNLTFAIDMDGVAAGRGQVRWMVGHADGTPLTATERASVDQALAHAVNQTNAELRRDRVRGQYIAGGALSSPAP